MKSQGRVATIGFFDGVHAGHRCLIQQVMGEAARRGMSSVLVTFARHPRQVVQSDYVPELLNTYEEKMALLRATGVDAVEVLDFDLEMSRMSASDFMKDVLRDRLGVDVLLMGYDHRFGHGGGTLEEYVAWGREAGIEVVLAKRLEGEKVSSSQCREALLQGRMDAARQMLGYEYVLSGHVVTGHQVGQQLGFPTANLEVDADKLVPAGGVYAVRVLLADGSTLRGMLNIGHRPTLNNGMERSIEVHVLDFSGNLYDQSMTLHFVSRLRDERRFAKAEELRQQLVLDEEQVRAVLA